MKQINTYIFILIGMVVISCSQNNDSPSSDSNAITNTIGQGGSMSRFAIAQNHLYVLTKNSLYTFDIATDNNPIQEDSTIVHSIAEVETIFPSDSTLFFGSTSGMIMFNIETPSNPQFLSIYKHIVSCDPVVAQGNKAYVTLRTGSRCPRGLNVLEVIDISNLKSPTLVNSIVMTNPQGLGILNGQIIVCDYAKLKLYNLDEVNSGPAQMVQSYKIDATDLIPQFQSNKIIVRGSDGIYQFSIVNNEFNLLSKIPIE